MKNKLFKYFNWKLLAIHAVASWFFIYAFISFALLYNVPLMEKILTRNTDTNFSDEEIQNIADHSIMIGVAPIVGMLIALIISLLLFPKKKWFWLNSVLMFTFVFLLFRFDLPIWKYSKEVLLYPGSLINSYFLRQLINGLFLLLIGIIVFILGRKISTSPSS